jgi:thiol-disulfide isomerase/thioredoxin
MDLAVSLNDQVLLHALILYKSISKGNVAPDFDVELKENNALIKKKLTTLEGAESYIVVFWSSTCSHCLDEIPQLQTFIKTFPEGKVKVIAIGLEDEPYEWKDLTYNYPEFIHVYGEGKWDNDIGNAYGVTATPTYFVLDKDKKIIEKPIDFKALKGFYEN